MVMGFIWTVEALIQQWPRLMDCFNRSMLYLRQRSSRALRMQQTYRIQLKTCLEALLPQRPFVRHVEQESLLLWNRFKRTKDDSKATQQGTWTQILTSPVIQSAPHLNSQGFKIPTQQCSRPKSAILTTHYWVRASSCTPIRLVDTSEAPTIASFQ